MARTSKMPRYNEYNQLESCFGSHQFGERKWSDYLKPSRKLTLELGCGKAEVSLGLARKNLKDNFIGVDVKSDRMWRAALTASEEKLENVAFVQSDIRKLEDYFKPGSVDEIWITFPDPFPRKRSSKHRMTGQAFLELYKRLLKPGGGVKFKTDDPALFEWSLEQFIACGMVFKDLTFDLHDQKGRQDAKIITTFEKRWLKEGKTTHYVELKFSK